MPAFVRGMLRCDACRKTVYAKAKIDITFSKIELRWELPANWVIYDRDRAVRVFCQYGCSGYAMPTYGADQRGYASNETAAQGHEALDRLRDLLEVARTENVSADTILDAIEAVLTAYRGTPEPT